MRLQWAVTGWAALDSRQVRVARLGSALQSMKLLRHPQPCCRIRIEILLACLMQGCDSVLGEGGARGRRRRAISFGERTLALAGR